MHALTEEDRNTIREHLRKTKTTQGQLAAKVGVSPVTVSRWLTAATPKIRDNCWHRVRAELESNPGGPAVIRNTYRIQNAILVAMGTTEDYASLSEKLRLPPRFLYEMLRDFELRYDWPREVLEQLASLLKIPEICLTSTECVL